MAKLAIVFAFVLATAVAVRLNQADERIIGGKQAGDGQYPYQVSLRTTRGYHFCGGSIISPNWILTAAHCVHEQPASSMVVVVGTNHISLYGSSYDVAEVITHERYNPKNSYNDIAVLKVDDTIRLIGNVQKVWLANTSPPPGSSLVFSGWGLTSFPGTEPKYLQHIELNATSVSQCQQSLPGFPIDVGHQCTLEPSGRGVCSGDSGGPLVYGIQQVGIHSWNAIPCAIGYPDIFTSVPFYRQWIYDKTGV